MSARRRRGAHPRRGKGRVTERPLVSVSEEDAVTWMQDVTNERVGRWALLIGALIFTGMLATNPIELTKPAE